MRRKTLRALVGTAAWLSVATGCGGESDPSVPAGGSGATGDDMAAGASTGGSPGNAQGRAGTPATGGVPNAASGGSGEHAAGAGREQGSAGSAGQPTTDDPGLLSDCESNMVTTGGYWWADADRYQSALIEPHSDLAMPFAVTPGSYDDSHACHVRGQVPGPLPADDARGDECNERLYPGAALGLSFEPNNQPYDLSGMAGITFWAKTDSDGTRVRVALAQTTTDVAHPEFKDEFVSTCLCTEEAKAVGQKKSCFGHYSVTLGLQSAWQQCYVFFRDMQAPSWAQDQGFNPTQAIKLEWIMPQPADSTEILTFDVWLDDIRWLTDAEAEVLQGPAASECVGWVDDSGL